MALEEPKTFKLEDLNMQVRLETCAGGNYFDLTGRKTFSVSMFKQGVGFGIMSIDITINTSLQPVIEITFKDLYGNSLFKTQNRSGNNEESIDYSVLFDWPPPKFILTIKGFLGKPVSWILNLKKTSTSFDSSDGSFEIKCSFVPNQWGFFADIPFLYLLAVKGLKKRELGIENQAAVQSIETIFDYIKIGKQIEVQKQETTKEFNTILAQMSSLKSNASNACYLSKIVNISQSGEEIVGFINNIEIQNFQKIVVRNNTPIRDEDFPNFATSPQNILKANYAIIMGSDVGNLLGKQITAQEIATLDSTTINNNSEYLQRLKIIDENIKYIDDEIKRRVFSSSESKIGKLTISEVFSKLAGDTAYILGKILEAGLSGYKNKKSLRKGNEKKIIGLNYPQVIDPQTQTQTPAFKSYGIEEHELKFANDFVTAIAEGVAEYNVNESFAAGFNENKLLKRINNLEVLRGNPYKSSYSSILENTFVRAGIISYVTRSYSPSRPGDFNPDISGNIFYIDSDDLESILKLVDADVQNISNDLLSKIPEEELLKLKRILKFWQRFLSTDGNTILLPSGGEVNVANDTTTGLPFSPFTQTVGRPIGELNLPSNPTVGITSGPGQSLLDYVVLLNYPPISSVPELRNTPELERFITNAETDYLSSKQLLNIIYDNERLAVRDDFKNRGFDAMSLAEALRDMQQISVNSNNSGLSFLFPPVPSGQNIKEYLSQLTLTSTKIINNGIPYCFPEIASNTYSWVVFQGEDAIRALEANSSDEDSDSDFKSSEQQDGAVDDFAAQPRPLGFISIDSSVDEDGDELGRVTAINYYIGSPTSPSPAYYGQTVLDYSSMINLFGTFKELPFNTSSPSARSIQDFIWDKKIVNSNIPTDFEYNPKSGGRIVYTVYSHQQGGVEDGLVSGIFLSSSQNNRGKNQRAAFRVYCDRILEKITSVEREKAKVVGNILGGSVEQVNSLYNQFHMIFHQWNAVLLGISDKQSYTSEGLRTPCGQIDDFELQGPGSISSALEERYSTKAGTENRDKIGFSNSDDEDRRVAFVYEYPYNTVAGKTVQSEGVEIRPEDSIVSIEPMYKPDSNTTVLNIIQNICQKNNFIFIPVAGNANYRDVSEIYKPDKNIADINIANYFHVLWAPTPENRTTLPNDSKDPLSLFNAQKDNFKGSALLVKFGGIDNQIIKSINVSTEDNKVTAESIVNLQRLADNENRNKTVTTDCSTLSVIEGRSYKATCETLGNAQIYPMQFFFIDRMPLFGGLYQTMSVKHSITPNNMNTSFEGVRMRFSPADGYGGEPPITLGTLKALGNVKQPLTTSTDSADVSAFAQAASTFFAGAASAIAGPGFSPVVNTITTSNALKIFFDTILQGESSSYDDHNWYITENKLRGYIQRFGGNRYPLLIKPLSNYTIGEIKQFQQNPRNSDGQLWATGRYQIIPVTLKGTSLKAGLSDSSIYNEENQDKLGLQLILSRQNIKNYLTKLTPDNQQNLEKAALSMSQIWSSLGVPYNTTGKNQLVLKNESYYKKKSGGDRAHVSTEVVQMALKVLRNSSFVS